ncbi:DUF998 domain-containing protein [Streptomyces sp. NPDC059970]|uniref:DUF998 domain-containing protein n=1 Tax=Streptomyces sp. NPDC059970 TaxID=3347019 RepID=UPI003695B7CF
MEDRSEHHTRPHTFRLGALGGMIGAITYSSFLLEALFRTGLNPLSSYISELSVPGRPYAFLFRTGDMIAGCGLLILAMALARRLPASPPRTWGCLALAISAAASIADGLWPMPCAPSADPACRATDSTDLGQQLRQVHTLSSLTEFTGVILAMLLLGMALHRTGRRRPARWSLAAGVATALLGSLEITMVLTGVRWAGLPERAQVLLVSAWCAAMARLLVRTAPACAPRRDVMAVPLHTSLTHSHRSRPGRMWPRNGVGSTVGKTVRDLCRMIRFGHWRVAASRGPHRLPRSEDRRSPESGRSREEMEM